ncbi:MAG: hypothetical protein NXI21_02825 [Alphaproteobacteria bacterium]|nr:hypothetical protein [Alphaproteobacteria bacterium]
MALKVSGGDGEEAGGHGPILIKDRYEVHPDQPLPDFDDPPAVAVRASHRRDSNRQLYALVCDPKLPPRLDIVSTVHRIDHRALQRVVDWGVVHWPAEDRRCPVILMERPAGRRVFAALTDVNAAVTEETVMRIFLTPVVEILKDLHALGVHHRNIRPNNLFFADSDEREIYIGECFSAQPGTNQPAVFETIECALAAPAGRGEGGVENDLYAVGVTTIALLAGKTPLADLSDEEVVRRRLAMGSYAALTQNLRISLTMMEPLRGLLNDDPTERWTLEELSLWLNGRRLSPKQQVMPNKASRGFTFAGRDYFTTRELAHAMHKNWDASLAPIRDGTLDTWLRRGLSEDERVEAVNEAKAALGDGGDADRLIARVLIALDPEGPIRLRDLSATIEGLASILGLHMHDSAARNLFASALSMGLGQFWLEQQRRVDPNQLRFLTRLDKCRMVMNQPGLGFGIERAAYEINQNLPCRSELFERDYIATVEHLIPAYERLAALIAAGAEKPRRLIDRDVAAYIAVHFKRASGGELRDVEREGDEPAGRIAQIRLLANIQDYLHKKGETPHLSALAAEILEPAIERFHSRDRRRKVRDKLRKAARSGRLSDLLDVIDDQSEVQADQRSFDGAVREYALSVEETIVAKRDIKNRALLAAEIGGQLSSTFSALGATMAALITFVVWWF